MSTRAKGNTLERTAKLILESWGYMVERAFGQYVYTDRGPRSTRHDFFGCIDLIAKNDQHTRYVQVTDITNLAARERKILMQIWPATDIVEVWAWRGGRARRDKRYSEPQMIPAQQFYIHRLDHDTYEFSEVAIVKPVSNTGHTSPIQVP